MGKPDLSELDFAKNKAAIRSFLESQSEFSDYDFEGSNLSILLDILAYNTTNLSFFANMAANEGFLDSAVLRDSIVSRAKTIGYVPNSPHSARAYLDLVISPTGSPSPSSVTIPKGTNIFICFGWNNIFILHTNRNCCAK
jgi:hypothetical protein